MENLRSKNGLGSTWMLTGDFRRKKRRAFAINRASVLGFRAIGGGHPAASKVFSFLGLSPINKNSWTLTSDNNDLYPARKYSVFLSRPA